MSTQLIHNCQDVQQNIHVAQQKSAYAQDVTLVAVTKSVDTTIMRQLYDHGIRVFGENRTHVLLDKQQALQDISPDIEWHFIGRLQTRQVKDLVGKVDYIHSLDRLSLAEELNKRFDKGIKCFVQVNVSGEATKTGLAPQAVPEFLRAIRQYEKVHVVGLMTMAPFEASDAEIRGYFCQMKQLQQALTQEGLLNESSQALSMGMSQDYTLAIEEGATHVRVGSALYEHMTTNEEK